MKKKSLPFVWVVEEKFGDDWFPRALHFSFEKANCDLHFLVYVARAKNFRIQKYVREGK